MSVDELLKFEADVHDEVYQFDPESFKPGKTDLDRWWRINDRPWKKDVYINGWRVRRTVELMGDLTGKRLLDVGCGPAAYSATLARMGAEVYGFDISPVAIEKAKIIAEANGVADRCHFQVASAGDIPFEDNSFDVVAAFAVLHHIWKYPNVPDELYRVLAPGGVLSFHDGLRSNRLFTGIRNTKRKVMGEEAPGDIDFEYSDLTSFASRFESSEFEYYALLMSVKRVIPNQWHRKLPVRSAYFVLENLDTALLAAFPFLRPYSIEVVGALRK